MDRGTTRFFKGRAGRRELILSLLVYNFGTALVVYALLEIGLLKYFGAVVVLSLGSFLTVEAYVRRLHDLGKNGWLWLLALLPLVGLVFFFALMVMKGEAGTNRYGPPPA